MKLFKNTFLQPTTKRSRLSDPQKIQQSFQNKFEPASASAESAADPTGTLVGFFVFEVIAAAFPWHLSLGDEWKEAT